VAVAVLIVNYRGYANLDRALGSLVPFLSAEDRVVVVDQVSDRQAIAAIRQSHPRVEVVELDENVGFAAGINAAASRTREPWLLWLNPDATVESPIVRALETYLQSHPNVGVVGPRVLNADGTVQGSARRFPDPTTAIAGRSTWLSAKFPNNVLTRRNLPARQAVDPVAVDWLAGSCLMTRRDLFDELGGLDEQFFMYWEDADYCRRVWKAGLTCVYLPSVWVRHIGGASAALNQRRAIRAFHASAGRLFAKHAGTAGRLMTPAVRLGLWVRGELKALRVRQ
jgi:GT2 family glycosyltransferase